LKKLLLYLISVFFILKASAQYYFRGEVRNIKKELLQNVKINVHSTHLLYYTGDEGGYGIISLVPTDSVSFCLEGYESQTVKLNADIYQKVVLQEVSSNSSRSRLQLVSITRDMDQSSKFRLYQGDESYFSLVENEIVNAKKYPNTGFSLNVDKASYSNIRRFLNLKSEVPPDAVRIEELLNYFGLHYSEPDNNQVFKIESQVTDCPWNEKNKLLYLNINARKLNLDKVPPCNLVFLIDASGSMDMPGKLPLIKAAFQMLVKNLRPIDTVSIITYGGSVTLWLQPTSGGDKQKIIQSIEEIDADGDTPGEAAIRSAYSEAKKTFIKNGNNRIILATDGDFNVGETSEEALEDLIEKERKSGVYLTCLGVGTGNFKDSKMEILAKKGNGNYAYLDNIAEAEKVLVKEMTQTFFVVANNVFLNVQFNPDAIKEYRLIGFDNKKDAIADSTGELEGGEVGSGHSEMAVFEITPTSDITKMQQKDIAQVSLKYNLCNDTSAKLMYYNCPDNYTAFKNVDKAYQFATALTMFGMKLRQSKFIGNAEWSDIENIATSSLNPNEYLQKEFLQLILIAKKIYGKKKKKYTE
jgi:Ca-activated chloride channel homolog